MVDFEVTLMEWISSVFSACVSWVFSIFDAANMVGLFVSCVCIYLTFQFLIKPLRGGSSDKAKAKNSKKGSDGE